MVAELQPEPPLFQHGELRPQLQARLLEARTALERWDADDLLQTPNDDVIDELSRRFSVDCPSLLRDQIQALPTTDASRSFSDGFGGTMRQRVIVRRFVVPFTGDPDVFGLRAGTFMLNPPRGVVTPAPDGGGELQISLQALYGQVEQPEQIRGAVRARLDTVDTALGWARDEINAHNQELRSVLDGLAARKAEILRERDLQAAIGFPVRQRADANRYAVPVRRKTIAPRTTPGQRAERPFQPEPTIIDQDYEAVLRVLTSSRNQLERTPSMAATLSEETIRDLLLVSLNAQFEGAAVGEVFNGAGKTDILIREQDRNIFIAECKIWRGSRTISSALDQLLSYLVWRDTKAALLLFIRRGQPSEIIAKSDITIKAHSNYKRTVRNAAASERSDYLLHANGDPAREIRLAFLPFVLPAG